MNVLVLLSGGIDSATVIGHLLKEGHTVEGLFVNYGQSAIDPEQKSVRSVAEHFGIGLTAIEASARVDRGVGEIIGRNLFLISAGLMHFPWDQGAIALGLHSGTPYYDCSSDFIGQTDHIIESSSHGMIRLLCPLATFQKQEVYEYAASLKIPIALTYSCEAGTNPPCGNCLSCRDRDGFYVR